MNFKFLIPLILVYGCGLKTIPTPPEKKFDPIESKYIKKYESKKPSKDKEKKKK